MRRLIAQASFVGVLCFAPFAPALEARECKGPSDAPLVKFLRPPPCETCPETKTEMDELASLERERTPEQEKPRRRRCEDAASTVFWKGRASASSRRSSAMREVFHKAAARGKGRSRGGERYVLPYAALQHAGKLPCIPSQKAIPNDSFSYPSGHAAYGATMGFSWSRCFQKRRRKSIAGSTIMPAPG